MRTRPEQVPGRRVAALALVAVRQELVAAQMDMPKMKSMAGMTTGAVPTIPPVTGYSEGQEILFLHTEASDPDIAKILTDMMGSAVLVVPSLATAPQEMLSRVYVCYQRPRERRANGAARLPAGRVRKAAGRCRVHAAAQRGLGHLDGQQLRSHTEVCGGR